MITAHLTECPVNRVGGYSDAYGPVYCQCREIERDMAEVHADMEIDSLLEER